MTQEQWEALLALREEVTKKAETISRKIDEDAISLENFGYYRNYKTEAGWKKASDELDLRNTQIEALDEAIKEGEWE